MFDLSKFVELNSATKYPSIETYHVLGDRGSLTEDLGPFAEIDPDEDVVLTEKVDGANFRIVLLPDGDYFIGIREELIYAKGDRIVPTALNGAAHVAIPYAERVVKWQAVYGAQYPKHAQVFFFEVYGSKIGGAAKNYTKGTEMGARLFDVAFVPLDVLDKPREEIASWRDHGGQTFATEATMLRAAEALKMGLTPRLGTVKGSGLPQSVERMQEWLEQALPTTQVALDDTGLGRAEGIVLRTKNRSRIAKARLEDYEKTLRRRNEPQGKRR
jgi:hypothetical protein